MMYLIWKKVAVRTHLLKENVPAELPEKYLPVSNDKASTFNPFDLMDTPEELEIANLRTDRYHFTSGEEIQTEAWICNPILASR